MRWMGVGDLRSLRSLRSLRTIKEKNGIAITSDRYLDI
jgi:hypothetical protein